MACIYSILLHYPSHTILKLKTTRLGGNLYLCSTLRNNATLRHYMIHENHQLLKSEENDIFLEKNVSTDLPLRLCSLVKENLLEVRDIQSDPCFTAKDEEGMIFALQIYDMSSDAA